MSDSRKSLMPNADGRYVAENKDNERARRVELDAIRDLEAKEAAQEAARRAAGEENDSRASGVSLQMGSAEYREMVYDRQGMDEFEQMAAEMERTGSREADDYHRDDKWHGQRQDALADERPEAKAEREAGEAKVLNHRMTRRARKISYTDEMIAAAGASARGTETKEDDNFVRRGLPDILEEGVYNDAEAEEDFYPGSKTLNKYM